MADDIKEYYWWDGSQKRVIKVIENILVEVPNEKPQSSESPTGGKGPGQGKTQAQQKMAEKLKTLPAAFKVERIEGGGQFAKIHVKSNNFHEDIKQNLGGLFSPFFQDGASGKALAGGVIITFRDSKTDEEARSWAEAQGLKLKEKMGLLNGRTWLVESAVGLASLELANQLHDAPDIETSQPNWAHDFSSRSGVPRSFKTPLVKKTNTQNKHILKKDMLRPENAK